MYRLKNLYVNLNQSPNPLVGWSGRVMMLGNFQCLGMLPGWILVGRGPTVLAVDAVHVRVYFSSIADHMPLGGGSIYRKPSL